VARAVSFGDSAGSSSGTLATMMRFCGLCNNMLYPRENKQMKALEYYCKQTDCSYTERNLPSSCVFVNEIVKDAS
jgi:DNA-directed RNA polymerase subunit M/transcription elongation factor TFIIS